MSTTPTKPPVTGVTARYQGQGNASFTTTFYYWIQALYIEGWAALSTPSNTGAYCPAALTGGNIVNLQWNPSPGAIGYLVYRNTTGTTPNFGATAIFIATSETGFKDDGSLATFTQTPRYDGVYVAKMIWDFATDGGTEPTAIIPAFSDNIPKGALVFGGIVLGVTTVTGATAIKIGTSAGSAIDSIMPSNVVANVAAGTLVEVLGTNSQAATNKPSFKMSAAGQITIAFTVAAATAGRIEVFVTYVLSTTGV